MLRDEFQRIMELLRKSQEGQLVNVDEVFRQAVAFFEGMNEQLRRGTEDEKKDALIMMGDMYTQLMQTSKKLSEKAGLSEEELNQLTENPAHFSVEQWKSMQASKQRMAGLVQDLTGALQALTPQHSKTPLEKKGEGKKRKGRTKWMRT